MAKAHLTFPNGTLVSIEGTPEEVQKLLAFYSPSVTPGKANELSHARKGKQSSGAPVAHTGQPDVSQIVNLIKTCDQADAIETNILDRTSVVDRTLLPLYIVHEHLDNSVALTSGEISTITSDLGVPIATPNVSTTLSTTASRYVVGDKIRKQGNPVRYKLSRRGVQYMKTVIKGSENGK
jgi:hypothetical protein